MSRIYGGFGELPLRESCLGAALQTKDRALSDLFAEVDELREALRLVAHWHDNEPCWCVTEPFDDGSTRAWQHDTRCREIRELMDV
jgi:hypothetical protein